MKSNRGLLHRYQGHIGAALVLGGVDATGPQLFTIHPHGSTDKLPYVTMGSGSLAAMAVFESKWQPNMEVCTRPSPWPYASPPSPCSHPASPSTARRSARPRLRRDLRGYLQRPRLRLERRRVRDHRLAHGDAPQPGEAERARAEGALVPVPPRDDRDQEGVHPEPHRRRGRHEHRGRGDGHQLEYSRSAKGGCV